MTKKKSNQAKLMPIGKDGKEVDWFYGWPGIIKLTEALGKSWSDVGLLIEDTWCDRVSFDQIMLCQQVHRSLEMIDYYRRPRQKMAPGSKGLESDLHYAIRMDEVNIRKLYARCGKAKDFYKAVSQLYKSVMKSPRKNWVLAYKEKVSSAENKKIAAAIGKANKSKLFSQAIKKGKKQMARLLDSYLVIY